MLNASNFSRNLHVNAANNAIQRPTVGNRKARRMAAAVLRRERTSGTLDAFNDRQEGRWLHPTKGWRKINEKRTRASTIVSMTMQGFGGSNLDAKEALAYA